MSTVPFIIIHWSSAEMCCLTHLVACLPLSTDSSTSPRPESHCGISLKQSSIHDHDSTCLICFPLLYHFPSKVVKSMHAQSCHASPSALHFAAPTQFMFFCLCPQPLPCSHSFNDPITLFAGYSHGHPGFTPSKTIPPPYPLHPPCNLTCAICLHPSWRVFNLKW